MTAPIPEDYRERQYISPYSTGALGLVIHQGGVPTDADGDVTLVLIREETPPVTVFSEVADHPATGTYEYTPTAAQMATPGLYTLSWNYVMGAVPQEYRTYAEIGNAAPEYDQLAPAMKDIVDSVWVRIADLFDHPTGGPHMQTYFQSKFGRGRIAQLMRIGMGRLNTMAQPATTYTLDGDGGASFPVDQWGSLLESATWIEVVKHLRRAYVEQPNFMGSGAVSRLDRRDYLERWGQILSEEEDIFKSQAEHFKIRHMGFGRPRVLVSGGVYGRYGPTRVAGSVAARPRYWTRWYSVGIVFLVPWLMHFVATPHGSDDGSPTHLPTSGVTSIVQVDRTPAGHGNSR